jgi:Spy/CpxP family protein refolding chaperone
MKTWIWLVVGFLSLAPALAQDEDDETGGDKVQSAKAALITRRLNLTPEQAQRFWPVYDEFDKERRQNLKSLTQLRDRFQVASDDEIKTGLRQMTEVRQKDVAIEREYIGKFGRVISARQTAELYKTETEFQKAIWSRVLQGSGQSEEAVETARAAFLTNRMKLTAEQSRQFWPVYNELQREKNANAQASEKIRNSVNNARSDAEITDLLKQMADLRQKDVDLEKKQTERFLRIVNPRQAAMFYKGEIDFRRKIIQEWRERRREQAGDRTKRERLEQFRERREAVRERRNEQRHPRE